MVPEKAKEEINSKLKSLPPNQRKAMALQELEEVQKTFGVKIVPAMQSFPLDNGTWGQRPVVEIKVEVDPSILK